MNRPVDWQECFARACDFHPRRHLAATLLEHTMAHKQNPRDDQTPNAGKVDNDTNKLGDQEPTVLNQGQRTPKSRSDRESQVGSGNQAQTRRGSSGGHKR
jgi:hypothetical protein